MKFLMNTLRFLIIINMPEISLGRYKHYKGKIYEVIAVAKHSETLQDMVVYEAQYEHPEFGEHVLWTRPADEFTEQVEVDGKKIPRFEYLED